MSILEVVEAGFLDGVVHPASHPFQRKSQQRPHVGRACRPTLAWPSCRMIAS